MYFFCYVSFLLCKLRYQQSTSYLDDNDVNVLLYEDLLYGVLKTILLFVTLLKDGHIVFAAVVTNRS